MPTQSCNITEAVLNKYSYNKVPYACTSLKTLQLLLMLAFVVQFSSIAQSCQNLCNPVDCSSPGFHIHHQLPEFAQSHVNWVSDAIQLSYPLLCPLLLPSIFPSIRVFSNDSVLCIRWPNYWSFSISPSNEYTGLISYRIAWFDLAVQGTLKSLLQHHNSKASILQCSAFFMSNTHTHTWLLEKPEHWPDGLLSAFVVLLIISCLKTYTFCLKV